MTKQGKGWTLFVAGVNAASKRSRTPIKRLDRVVIEEPLAVRFLKQDIYDVQTIR